MSDEENSDNWVENRNTVSYNEVNPNASLNIYDFVNEYCRVLVIGAGGLGCELLKDIAMNGFRQIHIIDKDVIEISNLNRQFLFREADIGLPKAEVAASYVNNRMSGCFVTSHVGRIEDYDRNFYDHFHIIVCGLDSVDARRWINGMLISILSYEEGVLNQRSIKPLVDGGVEGFKGHARVILPGLTACIDCNLDLYTNQAVYPLCTIANTPRLPEHCIEYVRVMQWSKENPFHVTLDGDDPEHIRWVYEKSVERASLYKIALPTYRLVQGVLKNITPAVASTKAVIAGICATEVYKLATEFCAPLNNFTNFSDTDGIYTYSFRTEKNPHCIACALIPRVIEIRQPNVVKLKDLIQMLRESLSFQMKNPGLTAVINGRPITIYRPNIHYIEYTSENLDKSLVELGLRDGCEIYVIDATTPKGVAIELKYVS